MSVLHFQENHPLPAHRQHQQWKGVPLTFQPPFASHADFHIPMSMKDQSPCQATPCVHVPGDLFGPFNDSKNNPTGFMWTSDCKLVYGYCPTNK